MKIFILGNCGRMGKFLTSLLMIPFGGGTNVNGSLDITSSRKKISLDTKNLRNLEVHQNYIMAGSGFTGKEK